ncbi:WD40 repeat domain-containing protein [Streptomyces chartreusis]|uniref:WD40 repeat domain-containing protein n=1 Tax=Streptomyces chartreusis TaxID=1969 RepID=A0A7H8TBG2_STRCX|nr:WD40 repeat domain-containing protein [Streptomyces chartreusis]QKZ20833.1 hypothetical protein HUT05_27895 [Streptomyces chartreusis]
MTDGWADVPDEIRALLSDPAAFFTMDPEQVLGVLGQADDPRSRAVSAAYRASADVHRTASAVQGRQILALDAARLGDAELTVWCQNAAVPGQLAEEWHVEWASGSTADSRLLRTLSGHNAPVTSVATAMVDGRPVAVTGSRDAALRVWDLTAPGLVHELLAGRSDPVSFGAHELLSVATTVVDGHAVALSLHANDDEDEAIQVWDLETGRGAGQLVMIVETTTLDGRRVVLTMEPDRTLRVWDITTGASLHSFRTAVAIGVLEGRHIAVTTSAGPSVQAWDLGTGRRIGECLTVTEAFLLEDRRPFALAGPKGQAMKVWDLTTGRCLSGTELADLDIADARFLPDVAALSRVNDRIVAMVFDHRAEAQLVGDWAADFGEGGAPLRTRQTAVLGARRVALSMGTDKVLRLWDLTTSTAPSDLIPVVRTIPLEEMASVLSPDPADRKDLWDLVAGRRSGTMSKTNTLTDVPRATSRSVELHGRFMSLAADPDGPVTVLNTVDGRPTGRPLIGHTERVCAMDTARTRRGALAVTAGLDRTVRVWNLDTRRQQGEALRGHTEQVWDVAMTVVGGRPMAVTAGNDRTVRLWDCAQHQEDGRRRHGHSGAVHTLATVMVDGDPLVVSASADHTVRTWNLTTGEQVSTSLKARTTAMDTAIVNGHPAVVTASPDAALHILDPFSGKDITPPTASAGGGVLALATTTLDSVPVAVTAGIDRVVRVWDLTTGAALCAPITGHSSRITAIATTMLEGRPVAVTGSWDKSIRVWDLTDGRPAGELMRGHNDWVTAVVTTVIDSMPAAVTRGRDGTVRLWDLTTKKQLSEIALPDAGTGRAIAVTTSPNRQILATTSQESTLRFLDPATGRPSATNHLFPHAINALTATPNGWLAVAFGPDIALLRPRKSLTATTQQFE